VSVFDRCDANTMTIIDAALEESRRLGHNYLGTEHLLVAFTQHRQLLPELVGSLLPDVEAVRSALLEVLGRPPRREADLLKSVGVDLDAVRSAVRRTFGDEAIERLGRPVHQPWQPWRRPSRRCTSLLAGTMSVAPRVKQALERARQDADRRGRDINPAAVLGGLVDVEDALSNRLLRETGLDPDEVGRRLQEPA
jgi:ATP-dependent Clp protease ATP-binding subunit ClpA